MHDLHDSQDEYYPPVELSSLPDVFNDAAIEFADKELQANLDEQLTKNDGRIFIEHVSVDDDLATAIRYLVASKQKITELHISDCDEISDSGFDGLHQLSSLRVLSVANTNVSYLGFLDEIDGLEIVELDIIGTPLADDEETMHGYYRCHKNLCVLHGFDEDSDIAILVEKRHKQISEAAAEISAEIDYKGWEATLQEFVHHSITDILDIAPAIKHMLVNTWNRSEHNVTSLFNIIGDHDLPVLPDTFVIPEHFENPREGLRSTRHTPVDYLRREDQEMRL